MKKYFKLLRVHHYIKNMLIFAPLACSGELFDSVKILNCFICFIGFCAISSVVYIINDIKDIDKDRIHPKKRKRPLASGEISLKKAKIAVFLLLIIAILCVFFIERIAVAVLMCTYTILNVLYSFGLKNIPILDIAILVSGFLIRILCGSYATDIVISNWLYLTVMSLSMYFALGKRRNELRSNGNSTRKVLEHYPQNFLDKSMNMCLTLTITFYSLWSMDINTIEHYGSNYIVLTVPIVLLIILKYNLDVEGDSDGDPVEVLFEDKTLIVMCVIYLLFMFTILYLI